MIHMPCITHTHDFQLKIGFMIIHRTSDYRNLIKKQPLKGEFDYVLQLSYKSH